MASNLVPVRVSLPVRALCAVLFRQLAWVDFCSLQPLFPDRAESRAVPHFFWCLRGTKHRALLLGGSQQGFIDFH